VCDRQHEHMLLMLFEGDHVGKPMHRVSANGGCAVVEARPRWRRLRRAADSFEGGCDRVEELGAETIALLVVPATAVVVTGNVLVVKPAGTVTLAGTVAAGLLLDRVTTRPPAGAAEVSVAVPVDGEPPTTLAGFSEIDARAFGGASTVMTAVRVALNTPVIVTGVSAATGEVVMLNVAKPRPAGTVTDAGT